MVIETNTKRKNNNDLFDKLWYVRRQDSLRSKKSEGFVFDGQGLVANTAAFTQLDRTGSQFSKDEIRRKRLTVPTE